MDHQVEDHRHVGAARLEGGDTGGLDVERRADAPRQCAVRGREAFQVADLQHAVVGGGQGGEVVRLGQGGGDRLFHQHVLARPQGGRSEGVVCLGGGGDDQGVAGSQEGGKVEVGGAGFPADRAGALGVDVVDAGERGPPRGRGLQRVIAAEMAGTGNADSEFGRWTWEVVSGGARDGASGGRSLA